MLRNSTRSQAISPLIPASLRLDRTAIFYIWVRCYSAISYIDGEIGKLLYRGYPIEQLAEHSSYVEVCYLLIYGELPSADELKLFESTMVSEMMISEKLIEFYRWF
jgi:citrate synthase